MKVGSPLSHPKDVGLHGPEANDAQGNPSAADVKHVKGKRAAKRMPRNKGRK